MVVLNEQTVSGSNGLQVNNLPVYSKEQLCSGSSLQFEPYHCSTVFTATSEQMSSLFSSSTSTSMLSMTADSVIQQMIVPSVIELPPDDCHSLSIEEEENMPPSDNDHQLVQPQSNRICIEAEVHVSTTPGRVYFQV